MKTKSIRVFYCGMVATQAYSSRLGIALYSGAAANKMSSVVAAMRAVGVHSWLISMPAIGSAGNKLLIGTRVVRERRFPSVFLPAVGNRWLRKSIVPFLFACFCMKHVRRADKIIIYNHAPEYLLGLVVLRLKGIRPFLDIEDAPRHDEKGFGAFAMRQIFDIIFKVSDRRKLTVSQQVAALLKIREFHAVYGTCDADIDGDDRSRRWDRVCEGKALRIHYGGTLADDTGLHLFCAAVRLLAANAFGKAYRISFIVTGSGGDAELRNLIDSCKGTNIEVLHQQGLNRESFLSAFLSCHASLSLKLPGTSMSDTTFPSKVVEITSNGLLLITTRSSDVPKIFDDSEALFIDVPEPTELARRIQSIFADVDGMKFRAQKGHIKALECFDPIKVGKRLCAFIDIPIKMETNELLGPARAKPRGGGHLRV